MPAMQQTFSPIDGQVYVERPLATPADISLALSRAHAAQEAWKRVPVAERAALCRQAMEYLLARKEALGAELTYQMGRPIRAFVAGAVALTHGYVLGDPRDPQTTLGPLVRTRAADFVRTQVAEAVQQGARSLIAEEAFPLSRAGTPYLAPQILVDVNHSMAVMREESFGPVVGVMQVRSDEEAIRLMNDSPYGLTAAIWTSDEEAALRMGRAWRWEPGS